MISQVVAVRDVKRLKGGSQPHLMECNDGKHYVVKFQNNPQGTRILANEMFCSLLARELGLPVPPVAIVEVCGCLIRRSPDLVMQIGHGRQPCHAGLCFGSEYVALAPGTQPDEAPKALQHPSDGAWRDVENLEAFAGMMVFDKWTCNTDGRQVVFGLGNREKKYVAMMVDNGFCFNATQWSFPDAPARGMYRCRPVYAGISQISHFEPWLSRVEELMSLPLLMAIAESVPPEWYGTDIIALLRLLRGLDRRRQQVRELILLTMRKHPEAFSADRGGRSSAGDRSAGAAAGGSI